MNLSTLVFFLAALWSEEVASLRGVVRVRPNEVLESANNQCSDLENDNDPEPCEPLATMLLNRVGSWEKWILLMCSFSKVGTTLPILPLK